MGTITLSDKQQRRADILSSLTAGSLNPTKAAELLHMTDRQVRRLGERYSKDGLASVVHGNSGHAPANKTLRSLTDRIVALAGKEGIYHDFNTCHLAEMLSLREDIQIGRSTLDRLLIAEGVRERSRSRGRRVHRRRERRGRAGELLLIDGSPHDWLEKRGPRMCLMGAIDDATSDVLHLRFWPNECLAGYLSMAQHVVTTFGVPESFYHDKHTILVSPKEATLEDELAGRTPMSQFQETLARLGVEGIKAHSPQAKGRIERLWRTLQDRLIKEMRLAGISTREDANAFLPEFIDRHNAHFHVEPDNQDAAWVVPDAPLDLAYYFAVSETRKVRSDHTLSFEGTTLQVTRRKAEPSLAGRSVEVHVDLNGELFLYRERTRLAYQKLGAPLPRTSTPPAKPALSPEQKQRSRRNQMAHLHAGSCA